MFRSSAGLTLLSPSACSRYSRWWTRRWIGRKSNRFRVRTDREGRPPCPWCACRRNRTEHRSVQTESELIHQIGRNAATKLNETLWLWPAGGLRPPMPGMISSKELPVVGAVVNVARREGVFVTKVVIHAKGHVGGVLRHSRWERNRCRGWNLRPDRSGWDTAPKIFCMVGSRGSPSALLGEDGLARLICCPL